MPLCYGLSLLPRLVETLFVGPRSFGRGLGDKIQLVLVCIASQPSMLHVHGVGGRPSSCLCCAAAISMKNVLFVAAGDFIVETMVSFDSSRESATSNITINKAGLLRGRFT